MRPSGRALTACVVVAACAVPPADTGDSDPPVRDTEPVAVEAPDTDPPAEDTALPFDPLRSVSVRLRVSYGITGAAVSILQLMNLSTADVSCGVSLVGTGRRDAVTPPSRRYVGAFTLAETDCTPLPPNAIFPSLSGFSPLGQIYVPPPGDVFHTFDFTDTGDDVRHWVMHVLPSQGLPTPTPLANQQHWMTFTQPHTFDPNLGILRYTEVAYITLEGILPYEVTTTFEAFFGSTPKPPNISPLPLP